MGTIPADYSTLDDDDYAKQYKEFLESKAGVKGIVDSGVDKVPRIFIHPPENRRKPASNGTNDTCLQVPVIDLQGLENGKRMEIVNEIREAASTWGFFQIVNHGVPISTMDKMLDSARQFHEQTPKMKEEWYSADHKKQIRVYSDGYFSASKAGSWKDTLALHEAQNLEKEQIPLACRENVIEFRKYMMQFKEKVCELLSEALGLSSDYLANTECFDSLSIMLHYYPPCPEPELTWGIASHTDVGFLTILFQDEVGGLQVLHQDKWIDIPSIPGSLILNLGDFMQLITNDKFKSVQHRAGVAGTKSRVSVASFIQQTTANYRGKLIGPIKELLSEKDPPIYRETTFQEYLAFIEPIGPNASVSLPHFKL